MTEIYFGEREGRYSIHAEGHAGYRPGNDIVCAAISVLLQTLWVNLSEICGGSGTQKEGDGIFFFSLKVEEEMRPQAEALFYGTLRGLEMLAEEYPQNVRLHSDLGVARRSECSDLGVARRHCPEERQLRPWSECSDLGGCRQKKNDLE